MDNYQDTIDFLRKLSSKIKKLKNVQLLGKKLQTGTRLYKTDRGARTGGRIEAAQKNEPFDETGTTKEELANVKRDITNELLNREIEDIFKE